MPNPQQLITENLNIWTAAIKKRGSQGRGSSKKIELHGIKKLRELILELAVRGLLVPQNPNDEPASVLLEKIAAEKEQLVQDGKLKAQHQLPEILEENKPYSLPNGWAWAVLPQVLADDKYSIKRGPFGSAIKKAFFVPKGYKVYEQQNAIYDDFGLGDYYIDEEKYNELKVFEVKAGDLIISCSGTVGKVAVAPETMEKGIINQALLKITLNQDMLTNDYFKILFSAYYMKTETLTDLKGTAQKNMVSVKTLKSEPFPYPPYEELFRIVAKVDELMALCDQLEQQTENSLTAHQTLVETLLKSLLDAAQTTPGHASSTKPIQQNQNENQKDKTKGGPFQQAWLMIWENFDALFTTEHSIDQLKQTILQLAVMGKLVPQNENDEPASVLLEKIAAEKEQLIKDGKIKKQKKLPGISEDEKPFELPKGWEWARLGDLSYIFAGNSFKSGDFNETGGTRVIKITNAGVGELVETEEYLPEIFSDEYKNYRVEEGDLVMALTRPYISSGLKVSECPPLYHHALLNQRVAAIRAFSDTHFLYQFMQSDFVLGLYRNRFGGSGLQPNLKMNDLTDLVMPFPPETEQPRIVAKVDELMALCDTLKERIHESQVTQLHLADAMAEQALN